MKTVYKSYTVSIEKAFSHRITPIGRFATYLQVCDIIDNKLLANRGMLYQNSQSDGRADEPSQREQPADAGKILRDGERRPLEPKSSPASKNDDQQRQAQKESLNDLRA